jgi:hypothetical protein
LATAARKKASALSLLPPELQERLRAEPFPDWLAPMITAEMITVPAIKM